MYVLGPRRLLVGAMLALICGLGVRLHAGGSGFNTVVVVNQFSSNSCELGNYYCERRQIPPENLLRINWTGGNISWSSTDFQNTLLTPLLAMMSARQLTNQIDYVVLCMDIPFQTVYGTKINSTTSALFYGLKDDSGAYWMNVTNSYYASEQAFRQAPPASAPGYAFLTTMLTADSLAQAKALVDQGVASDGTWPAQPVVLAKSADLARNVRYKMFDNAIFNCRLLGRPTILRTNSSSPWGQSNLFGYETGLASFTLSPNTFLPGAMADSFDSFGGIIFGANDHTSLLAFINAGAAGSYGTVVEPSSNTQKFPNPQDYFYQGRGFTVAESYYQSIYAPYQGLVVAEPLAAPLARTGSGQWTSSGFSGALAGTAQLSVAFSGAEMGAPIQQIDLYVDGHFYQTLTNCAPRAGNQLSVTLNGYPVSYVVPAGATLASVASGLAAALNSPTTTNLTRVGAQAYGDRIELRSLASNSLATPFFFVDCATTNAAGRYYSAEYVSSSATPQLALLGPGSDGAFRLHLDTPAGQPCWVQSSTDLVNWITIFTNVSGGTTDFADPAATNTARRFYRTLSAPQAPALPQLSVQANTNANGLLVQVDSARQPCVILESGDQVHWTALFTNVTVGQMQASAGSSAGSADALTTFLTAGRCTFLDSCAYGLRTFNLTGSTAVGACLQLVVIKTNGVAVSVTITNQSSTATLFDMAQQLTNAIGATASLQGGDGLVTEDLAPGNFGTASFTLRALSPGRDAAGIQTQVIGSGGPGTSPSSPMCLDSNLSDLQPRNHLYVSAGAGKLAVSFALDTTQLPDGYHELAAVAYEGTDVRTQTRITLPVQIQNSSLSADLTLLDLDATASVRGTYHIQVAANTGNVSAITLFSTGGALATVTNQSTAIFTIDGPSLGVGLHPFYALVQGTDGSQYRTQVQSARLINPE